MLAKNTWPDWRGDAKAGTQELLNANSISPDEYRLGKTKVFIRNPNTVPHSMVFDSCFSCSFLKNKERLQCHALLQ
jgi:hypothetical protein